MKTALSVLLIMLSTPGWFSTASAQPTYAERLGWPEGSRVLILHVDDADMSAASNQGTIRAIEEGVANSFSVMMPTPWVPQIFQYISENPDADAGLNYYARQLYRERAGEESRLAGEALWESGPPVLDDLHNMSYGWAREEKISRYVDAVRGLKPGVTMMIMHCTEPDAAFTLISNSGPSRFGDLEAMLSDELAHALQEEKIILTTWRELHQRRRAIQ
ncbi:MAG: ChbG/HpnK family deacetylase [Pseudomonadota bacterium]